MQCLEEWMGMLRTLGFETKFEEECRSCGLEPLPTQLLGSLKGQQGNDLSLQIFQDTCLLLNRRHHQL